MQLRFWAPVVDFVTGPATNPLYKVSRLAYDYVTAFVNTGTFVRFVPTTVIVLNYEPPFSPWVKLFLDAPSLLTRTLDDNFVNVVCGMPGDFRKLFTPNTENFSIVHPELEISENDLIGYTPWRSH